MSLLHDVLDRYTFSALISDIPDLDTPRRGSWRCPFPEGHNHFDANPSAQIVKGADGREVYRCYGCGRWGSPVNVYADLHDISFKEALWRIAARLGLAWREFQPIEPKPSIGQYISKQKKTPLAVKPLGRITKTYPYYDEDGALLYEVCRFDPKDFRQRRPDGNGGWVWNLRGTRRVLYRLPQVLAAMAKCEPIWLCEGEKDADAMVELGYCGTTVPGGAGKWQDSYTELLSGCRVVVVCDNDQAGARHGEIVKDALDGRAQVWLVAPAQHKDVADMLASGLPITSLREIS